MARIEGVDLPRNKRTEVGLTYLFGIGPTRAKKILADTKVNPDTRIKDLTEAEVVGWVQAALGEEGTAAVYTSIDTQIQNQIDPPIITPPLPWSQPSA